MRNIELLKEAFIRYDVEKYANMETGTEWVPSSDYRRKIDKLVRKQKINVWKYVNTAGKKIAVIIIAFVLAASLALSVKAIREPVLQFLIEVYEHFTSIFVVDAGNSSAGHITIEDKYEPKFVPAGFEGTILIDSDQEYCVFYESDNANFKINQLAIIANNQFDAEISGLDPIKLNDSMGYYSIQGDAVDLIWQNGGYIFKLYAYDISLDTAVKIAESVKK